LLLSDVVLLMWGALSDERTGLSFVVIVSSTCHLYFFTYLLTYPFLLYPTASRFCREPATQSCLIQLLGFFPHDVLFCKEFLFIVVPCPACLPLGRFFPNPSILASQTYLVSHSSSILFKCPNHLSWACSVLFCNGWVPKVILIVWFHILSLLVFLMTLLKYLISAVYIFCFCFSVVTQIHFHVIVLEYILNCILPFLFFDFSLFP
jgi:hypothetical protein